MFKAPRVVVAFVVNKTHNTKAKMEFDTLPRRDDIIFIDAKYFRVKEIICMPIIAVNFVIVETESNSFDITSAKVVEPKDL
jgi:hypothetical protein